MISKLTNQVLQYTELVHSQSGSTRGPDRVFQIGVSSGQEFLGPDRVYPIGTSCGMKMPDRGFVWKRFLGSRSGLHLERKKCITCIISGYTRSGPRLERFFGSRSGMYPIGASCGMKMPDSGLVRKAIFGQSACSRSGIG